MKFYKIYSIKWNAHSVLFKNIRIWFFKVGLLFLVIIFVFLIIILIVLVLNSQPLQVLGHPIRSEFKLAGVPTITANSFVSRVWGASTCIRKLDNMSSVTYCFPPLFWIFEIRRFLVILSLHQSALFRENNFTSVGAF